MTELKRLQDIRAGFYAKAQTYQDIAKACPDKAEAERLRSVAVGFTLAATDMTVFIKLMTDEQWNAATAKLSQKDAA